MVDSDAVRKILEYFPLAKENIVVKRRIKIHGFSEFYLKMFAN
jgi:hypothetical protein